VILLLVDKRTIKSAVVEAFIGDHVELGLGPVESQWAQNIALRLAAGATLGALGLYCTTLPNVGEKLLHKSMFERFFINFFVNRFFRFRFPKSIKNQNQQICYQ